MFKKFIKGFPQELRDLWKTRMSSTWNKLSRGAAEIARVMPSAHRDQWRRNDRVQHSHRKHDKKG